MIGYIILSIFILLIIVVVYKEYLSQKRYESERKARQKKATTKTRDRNNRGRRELTQKEKEELIRISKIQQEDMPLSKEKVAEEKTQKKKSLPKKILPKCEYPPFTHIRLVEMGLNDAEAIEFVEDLIVQIESQIPLIENVLSTADFHKMERLTHSIKGSAVNIGTGGISDLLIEYNTYLKSKNDIEIVTAYFKALVEYTQRLKVQYT